MALQMAETANFPGQFMAQGHKCTNARTFHGLELPVSNSRTFVGCVGTLYKTKFAILVEAIMGKIHAK